MASRWLIVLGCVTFLLLQSPASAQIDNSCTYRYSWGGGDDSYFSFCLTKFGTLASLQSEAPNHTNTIEHLDPVNPVEGWALCDTSEWGLYPNYYEIPGLGRGDLPLVSQPNGPGKLPIIFTWPLVRETVTAIQSKYAVVFTMNTYKRWGQDKYEFGSGPITRMAALMVDGSDSSSFENSAFAAFGYNPTGHGVMVTGQFIGLLWVGSGSYTENGEGGVTSNLTVGCGQQFQPPFVGQGAIFNTVVFNSAGNGKSVFTYKVF